MKAATLSASIVVLSVWAVSMPAANAGSPGPVGIDLQVDEMTDIVVVNDETRRRALEVLHRAITQHSVLSWGTGCFPARLCGMG
jgi:hypothetical protein